MRGGQHGLMDGHVETGAGESVFDVVDNGDLDRMLIYKRG